MPNKDQGAYPANDPRFIISRNNIEAAARGHKKQVDPGAVYWNSDPRFARNVSLPQRARNAFMATPTLTDIEGRKAMKESPEHYAESRAYAENGGQWPMKPASSPLEHIAEVAGSGTRKVFTDPIALVPAALSGGLASVAMLGGGYEAATNAADQAYRYGKVKSYGDVAQAAVTGALGAAGGELAGKAVSRAVGGLGNAGIVPELLGRGYGAPLVGEGVQTLANAGVAEAKAQTARPIKAAPKTRLILPQ